MKKILKIFSGLLILSILSACSPDSSQSVLIEGETMGTSYTIKYLPENQNILPAQQAKQEIDGLLEEVNRQMSTYRPDSEISQFNHHIEANQDFPISDDFAQVVHQAIELNRFTQGALDITIGPLVNLWGFGPDKNHHSPTPAELAEIAPYIGIDKIQLNPTQPKTLRKSTRGVYLDLSSIAKGFGVDKVANYLENKGIHHYLVEIGGEVRAKGHNASGQVWQLGIEQPQMVQGQDIQIVLPLSNQALATSGDYRNFKTDETGKRIAHIINPISQQPITHKLASVSVVADDAMTADGLATGLFVLGEQKALELAERENLAIFLIIKTEQGFERKMSSAFQRLLTH